MPPPSSSTKALNAILPLIASSPYEAHQKARTFASRYIKSKAYDVAVDVLAQSAVELFKAGHLGSGTDLSNYVLEVYELKEEPVTDSSRDRLTQFISLSGSEGQWRKSIIDKAINWSAKYSPYQAGDPALHAFIGNILYREGNFTAAEPHFLASGTRDSARALSTMLLSWYSHINSDNVKIGPGIYAARGTLPYLQYGNILSARTFLSHFISQLISSRPEYLIQQSALQFPTSSAAAGDENEEDVVYLTSDPLLNFLQLIIRLCQRARPAVATAGPSQQKRQMQELWVRTWGEYRTNYANILGSPLFRDILVEIGMTYFDMPMPRTAGPPTNPLQDMFSSFMGGGLGGGGGAPRKPKGFTVPVEAITLD